MQSSPIFVPSTSVGLSRRRFNTVLGLASVLGAGAVHSQSRWPNKPVRIVVAYPPGGLADVMARIVQPQLSQALGQPVVIENRSGANGNLAATEVARNGGDGHSFLLGSTAIESVNPYIFERMPFVADKDLVHVALFANSQLFLITRPDLPCKNLQEFVAYARARPGKLSYGSAGTGSTPHVAGELFKQYAGIDAAHIPYRGAAPAIQDTMAGQIDFSFAPGTVFPTVRSGKLRLLAVASSQRTPHYPQAPTFAEEGFGAVYADSLFGIYAPANSVAANVLRLNQEINRLLAQPQIQARFAELGADAMPISPVAFKNMVQAETKIFSAVVKNKNITPD